MTSKRGNDRGAIKINYDQIEVNDLRDRDAFTEMFFYKSIFSVKNRPNSVLTMDARMKKTALLYRQTG